VHDRSRRHLVRCMLNRRPGMRAGAITGVFPRGRNVVVFDSVLRPRWFRNNRRNGSAVGWCSMPSWRCCDRRYKEEETGKKYSQTAARHSLWN
jgi:hypothetical protein